MGTGYAEGRRNLDKWELGKIALKLKPEVEARAKANMSAGGGDQKSGNVKSVLAMLPNPISSVDTRKELADAVGLGERTMGKVMQIDKYAPASIRKALDKKELSISRGHNISREIQALPKEEQEKVAFMAVELEKAKKEIRQADAESSRRHKIAGLFCKAFERAVLLSPTEENIRIWTECTRMKPEEIEDSVRESYELAQTFQTIGDILKNENLPSKTEK